MVSTGLWGKSDAAIVQGRAVVAWQVMTYQPKRCCPWMEKNGLVCQAWSLMVGKNVRVKDGWIN
jgi:hypothetical protein